MTILLDLLGLLDTNWKQTFNWLMKLNKLKLVFITNKNIAIRIFSLFTPMQYYIFHKSKFKV